MRKRSDEKKRESSDQFSKLNGSLPDIVFILSEFVD